MSLLAWFLLRFVPSIWNTFQDRPLSVVLNFLHMHKEVLLLDLNLESWYFCLTSYDSERKYEVHKNHVIAFCRLEGTVFPSWEEIPVMQKCYAAWLLAHNNAIEHTVHHYKKLIAGLIQNMNTKI